jgi:hypothetical protein
LTLAGNPIRAGNYDSALGYPQLLTASYTLDAIEYEGQLAKADKIRQTADLLYQSRYFANTLDFVAEGKYQNTLVNELEALQQTEITPTIRYFPLSWLAAQASYDFSDFEFHTPVVDAPLDQSADRHTVGGSILMFGSDQTRPKAGYDNPWFPDMFDDVSLSYFHIFNDARGSDYDYQGNRLRVAFDNIHLEMIGPPVFYYWFKNISATVSYTRDWNDYEHPNSQIASASERSDGIDTATLLINDAINKNTTLHLEYDYTNAASNLSTRQYDENVLTIGVSLRY